MSHAKRLPPDVPVTLHIRFRRIPPDTQRRIGRDVARGEALIAGQVCLLSRAIGVVRQRSNWQYLSGLNLVGGNQLCSAMLHATRGTIGVPLLVAVAMNSDW
jgi:hypothetical protein